MSQSPGERFRQAVEDEKPLQLLGVPTAYTALMAEKAGYRALYLSGASISNNGYGLPDQGTTTCDNVLIEVERLAGAVSLPFLVDIDTGWGDPASSVRRLANAGAAAVHIEDQLPRKRCGHLENKRLVETATMCRRIESAVSGKPDAAFVVMARTDALGVEPLQEVIARCVAYRDAGADMLFIEAATNLDQYHLFKEATGLPILANMTEFGKSPITTREKLQAAGVDLILYPLSVSRVMNHAAEQAITLIRREGCQESLLPIMQHRKQLYAYLDYRQG